MKQAIHTVLVDDESDNVALIQLMLERYVPNVKVVATFTDSMQALQYLKSNAINLLFLDIEMPRLNGFEMLDMLHDIAFKTVILSAYDEYGIKAVKHEIFDYLVKPIDKDELIACVDRYEQHMLKNSTPIQTNEIWENQILLPSGNEYEFIEFDMIRRCESSDNYTTVYLDKDKKILVSKTLKYIQEALPSKRFIRVHNRHLINVKRIRKYVKTDGGYFVLDDGFQVPLSRYKKDFVLKQLGIR